MSEEKKLYLLDAYALIYRAYFAFSKNPRINSKGQNTSAAFGFTNTLNELLKKEQPSHIGVVFDYPAQTNRSKEYIEYKANREETPEDIKSMIPYIIRICEAMNIPVLMVEGFEADDIIGTLAKKAEKQGFTTFMVTPDKDFGQLVSEHIFMYKPARMGNGIEILGVPEICEKFKIDRPEQVIDILGLWGDAVDNIPGIPGIGEKTSKKLIAQYGSVENLIKNSHELKGKQRENVENFAEQGLLSKKLATIITDMDIEFDADSLTNDPPNEEKLKEVFTELEFRNLAQRMLGEEITIQRKASSDQLDLFAQAPLEAPDRNEDLKKLDDSDKKYHLVKDIEGFIKKLEKQTSVCFDTETSSLNSLEAELVGIAFSWKKDEGYYVPFSGSKEEIIKALEPFLKFFGDKKIEKIAHNLKYDVKVLHKYNVVLDGPLFDTMIAHYLMNPEGKHNMDELASYYLHYKPVSIETLIGKKGKNQKSMQSLTPEEIKDYACEDADVTFQLKQLFGPKMEEEPLKNLFYNVEMPLLMVLAKMEIEGILLDKDALKMQSESLSKELVELEKKIKGYSKEDFNLDSPKQLGVVLFEELEITEKPKKTKSGQYSTSEDVLSKLKDKHEIVSLILNYRQMRKLINTYVDALPELINKETGRIHTHYMQTVAATGRLSSNKPNLQNIPIRTEKGREIRKAFIPRDDSHSLLAADYSQIELRIIAALSKDEHMLEDFKNGRDIHAATASRVFDVQLEEVTREQRSQAKAVNFGIIYGQSVWGLSDTLNIPRAEAKSIIDQYFSRYSGIKKYMEEAVEIAKEKGYVETILHRRRYLPDINSNNAMVRGFAERNAVNSPIQGSAADIIKIAMIRIQDQIEKNNFKSKMLLQVHDELVFDLWKEEQEVFMKMVKKEMEEAVEIDVPLEVEMESADNWLDAH